MAFLTETWLSDSVTNSKVFLGNGYTVIARSDRQKGSHGGVLIAVSSNFGLTVLDVSLTKYQFSIACAVLERNLFCGFILVYLPPSSSNYRIASNYLVSCLLEYYSQRLRS